MAKGYTDAHGYHQVEGDVDLSLTSTTISNRALEGFRYGRIPGEPLLDWWHRQLDRVKEG